MNPDRYAVKRNLTSGLYDLTDNGTPVAQFKVEALALHVSELLNVEEQGCCGHTTYYYGGKAISAKE
jgi:hypothetical protein